MQSLTLQMAKLNKVGESEASRSLSKTTPANGWSTNADRSQVRPALSNELTKVRRGELSEALIQGDVSERQLLRSTQPRKACLSRGQSEKSEKELSQKSSVLLKALLINSTTSNGAEAYRLGMPLPARNRLFC